MPAEDRYLLALTDIDQQVGQWLRAWPAVRIWLLDGTLGAGKTTLVQAFARAIGVQETVASPTFSLVHTYSAPGGPVHHLDLYRIKNLGDAYEAGLHEYVSGTEYCFVEWASCLPELWQNADPATTLSLTLEPMPNGMRNVQFSSLYAHT